MEHIKVVKQLNKFLLAINEAEDFNSTRDLCFQISTLINKTSAISSFCNKKIKSFEKYQKSSAFEKDIEKINYFLSDYDLSYMDKFNLPIFPSLIDDWYGVENIPNAGLWEFYLWSIVYSKSSATIESMAQLDFDKRTNDVDYFLFNTHPFFSLEDSTKFKLLKTITNKVLKDIIDFVSAGNLEAHKSNSGSEEELKGKAKAIKDFIDKKIAQGQFIFRIVEVQKELNITNHGRKNDEKRKKSAENYVSNARKLGYDIQYNKVQDYYTIMI